MNIHHRIDNDFTLHPPKGAGTAGDLDELRASYKALAHKVADATPPSREQSLALTALEESLAWSIGAIVRNQS